MNVKSFKTIDVKDNNVKKNSKKYGIKNIKNIIFFQEFFKRLRTLVIRIKRERVTFDGLLTLVDASPRVRTIRDTAPCIYVYADRARVRV